MFGENSGGSGKRSVSGTRRLVAHEATGRDRASDLGIIGLGRDMATGDIDSAHRGGGDWVPRRGTLRLFFLPQTGPRTARGFSQWNHSDCRVFIQFMLKGNWTMTMGCLKKLGLSLALAAQATIATAETGTLSMCEPSQEDRIDVEAAAYSDVCVQRIPGAEAPSQAELLPDLTERKPC